MEAAAAEESLREQVASVLEAALAGQRWQGHEQAAILAQRLAYREATPLLVGAKGSPLELGLSSLYFESDIPPTMRQAEVDRIQQSDLGRAIPLYTRFRTRHSRIVGTSLDYFEFRGMRIARGRRSQNGLASRS